MSHNRGGRGCQLTPITRCYRAGRGATAALFLSLAVASSLWGASSPARAGDRSDQRDRFPSPAIAAKSTSGWCSVILQLRGDLTPTRENQIRSLGGDVYRHLPRLDAAAVRVLRRRLARLAALHFVERLSPDTVVWKSDEFTVSASGADIAFNQQGLTGAGITVAVIDSGIQSSRADLCYPNTHRPRTLVSINFASDTNRTEDLCGHGTHVAGIIAGNGAASTGPLFSRTFYGIARGAGLINLRVLDGNGQGAVSNVLAAIDWAIAHKSAYNIRVLNLSLGHPVGESYTTDPLCLAVENAWRAGIAVVCAAGNQGRRNASPTLALLGLDNEGYGTAYGSIQSPGNSPYAITVGAMKSPGGGRASDRIATYSSRGPSRLDFVLKPDLVAPGNRVISVLANNSYLDATYSATNLVPLSEYCSAPRVTTTDRYFRLSGTSMAAPVVSGAIALMLEADPTLSPDTIKARLMVSADKWWGVGNGSTDPCTFGAGYLNIPAALRCPYTATRSALSPALYRDTLGLVRIEMQRILWDQAGVWGTGIGSLAGVWGTQVLWGENTLAGSQVLWGSGVWANQVLWGENTGAADLSSRAIHGDNR